MKPRGSHPDDQTLAILRKRVPGRPGCDGLERLTMRLAYLVGEDDPDVELLERTAAFVREARWLLKGGAYREGSRHWPASPDPANDPPPFTSANEGAQ